MRRRSPEARDDHYRDAVQSADLGDLVAGAVAGEQKAWDELVDRFTGLVWHVARAHRLSEPDAADVGQTVWLRLVESLPGLREPAAVGGWLATTTRHECLRVLRRAGREVPDDSVALAERPSPDASPDAVVELAEDRHLVRSALDRLSDRCRMLLRILAYSPDDSYADISSALGMPVGSIGPTRSRCLQHLRRELVAGGALAGD